MQYISQKKKITDFILNTILPAVEKKDLDYNKTIQAIIGETLCSRNQAKGSLKVFMPNRIQEIRVLTIPSKKLVDWLKESNEIDKEVLDDKNVSLN